MIAFITCKKCLHTSKATEGDTDSALPDALNHLELRHGILDPAVVMQNLTVLLGWDGTR